MIYLDSGVIVRGLVLGHEQHQECVRLLNSNAVSSCHSLAEVFNTLTGAFKIDNDTASGMLAALAEEMKFETIGQEDYLIVISEARKRGIQGGIIYDAIHAEIARRLKAESVVTYNITNFRHVAPDLNVVKPFS